MASPHLSASKLAANSFWLSCTCSPPVSLALLQQASDGRQEETDLCLAVDGDVSRIEEDLARQPGRKERRLCPVVQLAVVWEVARQDGDLRVARGQCVIQEVSARRGDTKGGGNARRTSAAEFQ